MISNRARRWVNVFIQITGFRIYLVSATKRGLHWMPPWIYGWTKLNFGGKE